MSPRKPPSDDQLREAFVEVGDALQRAVVLSSDRVQSVFEDAVLRGRMTRRDAEELASSLVALGRDQALELRGEVDAIARAIPSKVAATVDPRTKRRKKKARAAEKEARRQEAEAFVKPKKPKKAKEAKGAKPPKSAAAKPASLPADPQAVTVRELLALIPTLAPADLTALRTQEAAGKARVTVLKAIDQRIAA